MQNDNIPFRSDLLPKISDLLNVYVIIFIINPKIMIYIFNEDHSSRNCKSNKMCKSSLIRFYLYAWYWLISSNDTFITDKSKSKFKCYLII